ncbi:MAG: efflux RND transporter periplasmic adaptor subunit [Clostridia bacterium]|nr:efflux RND transporter periplasmic adaptor subunit [Clostridia bacterium]
MRRKNKKKKKIWLVILVLALCLAGFALSRNLTAKEGQKMRMVTVERGTIETYKSFSATLNVENSETISNTEGVTTIKELYVKAGQLVSKGDPLVMLGTGKVYEASIGGTVNEMRFKKGDFIWPNVTLVQVSDLEHLEVQIQVDEYDVKKVEVGQKCYVTIVPLSMEIETVITHVNRMSASNGRVAYYPVTAKLEVPDSVLPGMTVSVRMADDRAENVLTLPLAALSFDEDGKPFVYGKDGDNMKKIVLETGLSDGMQIEILSGVTEGEQVYTPVLDEEEETTGPLTRLLRQIFGTHSIYNEEKAVRGARDSGRNGQRTGTETGNGQMPGREEQGSSGPRQNSEQGQSTPSEASRAAGEPGQAGPAVSSGTGETRERPGTRGQELPVSQSETEAGSAERTRSENVTDTGSAERTRPENETDTGSAERIRPEKGSGQQTGNTQSQRSGSGRQRNESAEESAQ